MPLEAAGAATAGAPGEGASRVAAGETLATRAGELAAAALMLLPGALVVFTGFNAGGYFPATPAIVAIVLTQILLVRILQSSRPFAGFAPATLVAIAALGLYTLLTLASALWSHALGRALIEFDRAWMYLLILVLFGSVRARSEDLRRLIWGLLAGASIVCLAGLITRVLPQVWHTAPAVSNERLSYPVTYWNTLGLLAALGIVLAFHITCSLRERRPARIAAAALTPLLAATLFFTFSRGAIAAGAVGLLVYVLVARPSGLLSGALATLPATAALVLVAYHANLLDTIDPTTPAAVIQGHHVALVAGLCAIAGAGLRLALALTLDPALRRHAGRAWLSRGARAATLGTLAVVAVAAILALGVPHAVAHDWSRFIGGASTNTSNGDLRARLSDPSNDGRTDLWRVALHGFSASPLHGAGAGMYQTLWDRNRPHFAYVIDAHSLYLQAMAELGVGGLALLLVLVGAVFVGLARRARGEYRSLYGALLAVCVVWALRAGVDWDWEMPVVTLVFFAVAGAALSPLRGRGSGGEHGERGARSSGWVPGAGARIALGVLCLVAIVTPVLIIGSQRRLGEAQSALYETGSCPRASSAALSSIGWLDVRPEPYEIVGFCDLREGRPRQGVAAMSEAVSHDPGSWETHYALALAQAAAGIDPRGEAEQALRMDPYEPLTEQAAKQLRTAGPAEWVSRARALRAAALKSKDLSIFPS
jgi:O-Antigen ligase